MRGRLAIPPSHLLWRRGQWTPISIVRFLMSNLLGIIILSMAPQKPAGVSCDLDDCQLSDSMHQVHPSHEISHDRWSWINHDLAIARFEARRGQHATAIQIATNLDASIRNGLAQLLIDRGPSEVLHLYESLQAIVLQCNGHPLEPLNLTMDPIAIDIQYGFMKRPSTQ